MNISQFFREEVFGGEHDYHSALNAALDLFFARQDVFARKWSEWNAAKSKDDLLGYRDPVEL